jgi:DNA-binding protein YbaB
MSTPFPDPRSLLGGLLALERSLATFESGRAGASFVRASSDTTVTATVNGLGRVVSISIAPSQLSQPLQTLANKVKDTVNAAIDAAYAASIVSATSFANTLTLPGLPAPAATPPDYPDFVLFADSITSQILANNPCQSTTLFECRAGRVRAVVDAHRRCTSLTFDAPLPNTIGYWETRSVEALNCAIDDSTEREDETTDVTDGITDSYTLEQLVLYARGQLILNDRVKIKTLNCAGWASIANAGTIETKIGVQAELQSIVSRAPVEVRDRGIVHGFIHSAGAVVLRADTQVTGPVEEHAVVILPDLALNVPFPGVTQGTIELEPNQQQTAGPGYYNKLVVKQGAQATLSAGVYYFNDFDLEPGGTLRLVATAGPIVIWVKNTFIFRGGYSDSAGGFPRVFAGYLGTATAIVESKYRGTLAAPNAKISISTIQSHEGAFHGKDIEVQPDTQICYRPFELRYNELPGLLPPGGLPPPVVDLSFETVSGWSSPQSVLLTSTQNPVTQGARSLQISNVTGTTNIVSGNFSADLAPNGATRAIVDLWVPSNQPNPTAVGNLGFVISVPSAGINALSLGSLGLTSLPRNQFNQLEFPLPTAVQNALNGTRNDVSVRLALAINSGSGPWYIDNVRFLLPPPPASSLDPILSFEDTTKWSCAQAALSSSTTTKTHLTKSLRVASAPGSIQIVSAVFASGALSAPTGKFRIDVYKPSNQSNSSWHGQFQLFVDVPSAGISNAGTGVVELTPRPANQFSTLELALPSNVAAAINGEFSDVKLRLSLNAVAGSGPWHFDNIRFV